MSKTSKLIFLVQLIVRPLAVACTAIHGIFDITEQFKQAHVSLPAVGKNVSTAEKYLQLPTDLAYIKHIRWFGPPNGTLISCKFGAEVKMWDPDYALIVQASLWSLVARPSSTV